jgi:hypothetical protein
MIEKRLFELFKDLASDFYIDPVDYKNTDFLEVKMALWLRDNYTEHFISIIQEEKIKELVTLWPRFTDIQQDGTNGPDDNPRARKIIDDRIKELKESNNE